MVGCDLRAVFDRDPAARSSLEVLLTYPGFHAVFLHRLAHPIHRKGFRLLARILSAVSRFLTGIEIHPGASIGEGFFIDHGMGVVIGETTIIGADVTLFQGVSLGGNGKDKGHKRHPTLGNHVLVGAGAKILGDIRIGDGVRVGSNAVVLRSVPSNCTVVGIPGRVVRSKDIGYPEDFLNHQDMPDPYLERIESLERIISDLREELHLRKNQSFNRKEDGTE
ncbi:MAG: serine O-acetyltransferase [Nitrospiraceae bacterium]|nr:serine O-acetyltransferase [Nitrospiraceae bacterium]MDA8150848.1 serine O-acetyltransferase [Nitrospiraceae bacterium]